MQLIENASDQKLRGAYYTPAPIARFILQWGVNGMTSADILEPSCGDGVFIECLKESQVAFSSVTAVEYEETEARKAAGIELHDTHVLHADFHQFCLNTGSRFDFVVGNPPFIRYQYYDAEQQKLADEIFKRSGLKRTKLTNAWVTFVVGSCLLLKAKGRIGFVIPSELLMVKYARQLRHYLATQFNKINIISFKNLVFEEIQQEVVLLLCERNGTEEHLIEHLEVKDAEELIALDPQSLQFPTKKIDFHTDKWTYYFLEKEELDLLEKVKCPSMPTISMYADVEVGITTGSNGYFTVSQSVVNLYDMQEYAHPLVGRSVQVNSALFSRKDWERNIALGSKANILVFPDDVMQSGTEGAKTYIANGEKQGINKGYKTSIRDHWFVIPSIKLSDALFLRRNNIYPKFVLNEAGAYTTDTMHRVFIHEGVNKKALVASYYNSLSFAFAEILGRNFGGGCLELMPSEVGGIYMPYNVENEKLFDKLDSMLREHKSAEEILDYTDEIILHKGMGLTVNEVKLARSIWHKIVNRRLNRKAAEKKIDQSQKLNKQRIKQLDLFEVMRQYPEHIVTNNMLCEPMLLHKATIKNEIPIDINKNVLVSLVKKDNFGTFLNNSATIYYTGKRFPSTVELNKLYYFVPYLKGKGIRDLYVIKTARVGCRKEGQQDYDPNDIRLVFEIQFIKRLFDDYVSSELEIWRTYTDTTLSEIFSKHPIKKSI